MFIRPYFDVKKKTEEILYNIYNNATFGAY